MPSPVLLLSAGGCGQVSNGNRFDPLSPPPLAAFGAGSLPGSAGVPLALPNDECGMMRCASDSPTARWSRKPAG